MTIARRLIILAAIPNLVLMGLGTFNRLGLTGIERRSRFTSLSPELKVWVRQAALRLESAPAMTAGGVNPKPSG